MIFAQPLWLAAGAVCCLILLALCRVIDARRRSAMSRFAAGHLVEQLTSSVSTPRLWIKRSFFLLGIAFLFVALARPQWGFRWEETKRTGLDILFAVDTSKSMLAQDVKPDRLTRAKLGVTDMVAQLEGDRVGLIAFAGSAFLQCPLTLDYDAFYQSLDALDTAIIPRGGTNIAAALQEAGAALSQDEKREKILILLTDGEDLEGAGLDAAKAAAQQGMKIFTVGVGGQGGELIPVPTEGGGTEFLKDASGNFVKSKLDASMLQKIAQATGGIYQPLGSRGEGLQAIYDQGLAHLTKHDLASRMRKVFFERFQWPLAAGLLLLTLELLVSNRAAVRIRKTTQFAFKKTSPIIKRTPAPTAGITAGFLALLLLPSVSHASASQAAKAYSAGDYPTAQTEFEQAAAKNPASSELQFNTGAASYKTASFDKAAESFEKTLQSKDLNLQEQAYYNLGNAQYRIGQLTEKSEPKKTIETWKQAIQSYEAALQLKTDDADAIYNRDLVKRKLDKLQQEQNKKDQQDKQDQKDKKDDKKDQDQKDQDQKNQDQQKKEGDSQDKKDGNDQKDQNGQPKQDQQGQDQQGKDGNEKKDSSGGGDEKKDQQAKQDPKQGSKPKPDPKADPKERDPQQAGAKPKEGKDQQAAAQPQRVPGQMSREEAAQLLDSLKDDAKKFPVATAVEGTPQSETPQKDW